MHKAKRVVPSCTSERQNVSLYGCKDWLEFYVPCIDNDGKKDSGQSVPLFSTYSGGCFEIISKYPEEWHIYILCTSYPKVTAITEIRNPNKNSNLRKPYLSKNRNVNVSTIVIRVPTHSGTLKIAEKISSLIEFELTACININHYGGLLSSY